MRDQDRAIKPKHCANPGFCYIEHLLESNISCLIIPALTWNMVILTHSYHIYHPLFKVQCHPSKANGYLCTSSFSMSADIMTIVDLIMPVCVFEHTGYPQLKNGQRT